jgi:hypothetical protein
MKRLGRGAIVVLVALAGAVLAGSVQAEDINTTLYIAHAASGRSFGSVNGVSSTNNPSLPIDVSIEGNCIAKGLAYGQIGGPYVGAGGSYSIQVTVADTIVPCSGIVLYSLPSVTLNTGMTNLGVITVDGNGNIQGQIYPIDLTAVPANQSRVEVANATQATVSASVSNSGGPIGTLSIAPATIQEGYVNSGTLTASITDGAGSQLVGPLQYFFGNRDLYLFVLSGSSSNGSEQLIGPAVIYGVF